MMHHDASRFFTKSRVFFEKSRFFTKSHDFFTKSHDFLREVTIFNEKSRFTFEPPHLVAFAV